jgi:predicted lipoprotein with Yx(FWY)xxD motif
MKRNTIVISLFASLVFALSACGAPTPAPTAAPAPTTAPAAAPAAAIPDSAKVMVADSSLGKILVDDKGFVLYVFTKDTDNTSTCYDQCATAWPAVLTKNAATAGAGVDASLFGTTTRKDGTMQVTYKKMPLYYYAKDMAAGDTKGQAVGKVWYIVSPAGDVIGK